MKRKSFLVLILAVFMSACIASPSITADSIEDLRVEYPNDLDGMRPALKLNCSNVVDCHNWNLYPDKYYVERESEELYVWVREYFPGDYLFYVVIYRPYENTWDGLGFEKLYGSWKVGVRTGTGYTKTGSYPIYDTKSVNSSSVVLGYSGENWAVVVNATSDSTFEYKVIPNYWEN